MDLLYEELEDIVTVTNVARTAGLGDSLALGPLDHVSSELVYLAVCFTYISELSFDRLRLALRQTLDRYPHLTGRFRIDTLGNRSIDSFGGGAVLQKAASRARLSDARDEAGRIDMTLLPGAGSLLVPSFDSSRPGGDPLFSVKMTVFEDGSGTVLGVRAPHGVCDAAGFFALVGHLAQMYNASGGSDIDIDLAQTLAIPYAGSPTAMTVANGSNVFPLHEQHAPKIHDADGDAQITGRFVHLGGTYLQKLKITATPSHDTTSRYRAATAHLWQTSHRAARAWRQISTKGRGTAGLTIAVNLRKRLPSVPVDLVFNGVLPCSTIVESDTLHEADLKTVAQSINDMRRQELFVNPGVTEAAITWIHDQSDKTRIDFGWAGHFVSTQWPSDMYETSALDGVRPDLVCLPILPGVVDGLLIVMPAPVRRLRRNDLDIVAQDEGLMAALCLDSRTWEIIDNLDLLNMEQIGKPDRPVHIA